MSGAQSRPKVLLFDIGGVCVRVTAQAGGTNSGYLVCLFSVNFKRLYPRSKPYSTTSWAWGYHRDGSTTPSPRLHRMDGGIGSSGVISPWTTGSSRAIIMTFTIPLDGRPSIELSERKGLIIQRTFLPCPKKTKSGCSTT